MPGRGKHPATFQSELPKRSVDACRKAAQSPCAVRASALRCTCAIVVPGGARNDCVAFAKTGTCPCPTPARTATPSLCPSASAAHSDLAAMRLSLVAPKNELLFPSPQAWTVYCAPRAVAGSSATVASAASRNFLAAVIDPPGRVACAALRATEPGLRPLAPTPGAVVLSAKHHLRI